MTNDNDNNPPEVQIKKHSKFNHVWWLPLIALCIVVFMGIQNIVNQGPLITIRFTTAQGLIVDKTKVKFKELDIGKVEKIVLDKDHDSVLVSVRMNKGTDNMLKQNTQFWVVKPRVGITQISGLNTLLSGNYIAIEPDDKDSEYRDEFVGLSIPPIVNDNTAGLKFTLLTSKASSLNPGTPIYYKGIKVGTINRVYFSKDYLWVKADAFISSPHDELIKNNTRFWSVSGFSVDATPSGIDFNMESVEALVSGGIAFETPASITSGIKPQNGIEYILYDNKTDSEAINYGKKRHYLTYFNASVQGLTTDSPVVVQGIQVGKVNDIKLIYDQATAKTQITVLFEIYEERLGLAEGDKQQESIIDKLIKEGLHTQLAASNFLTGSKQIALVFNDKKTYRESLDNDMPFKKNARYPIIPSTPQNFDAIAASVTQLVNKLNQLPIEDIANQTNDLIKNTNKKISQVDVQQTIENLNQLLTEGKNVSKETKKTLKQLNQSIRTMVKTTKHTLSGYSPDAPLYYNLNSTLIELNDTLRSIKQVSDKIDRTPNALIFGEKREK